MVLQEPTVLFDKTMLSVAFGLRNHMMVPQEPSLFEHSSTKLNTSAIVLSQDPYHGSSGSIPFDKQFHKFEHFCMPPRAPFIILNKARGGTRNLHPEAHPALFSIIRGGRGSSRHPCRKRPKRSWRPRRPWRSRRPFRPRLRKHRCRHSRPRRPWRSRRPKCPLSLGSPGAQEAAGALGVPGVPGVP